jgi:hypothetical protein
MIGQSTAPAADLLETLRRVHGASGRAWLAPEARVLFIQVNKNACTSLKWMMAGLAGEDLEDFRPGLWPCSNPHDAIHNRRSWKKSPTLDALSPAQRAEIHPDNGWFVFAVTRDARSRLFSAWQNKLLVENPGYTHYRGESWYPRHPLTAETVVADFARFVDLLLNEPDHRIQGDPHFRDQTTMLQPDDVPYSGIYDIREFKRLRADLEAHLAAIGWTGELWLPNMNDTPLRTNAAPFANGVRERVEKIYAADFARFGDRWDFAAIEAAPDWTEAELERAELMAVAGRRIGDVRDSAIKFRAAGAAQRRRATEQKERADALQAEVDRHKARADALQRQVDELTERRVLGTATRARFGRIAAGARRRLGPDTVRK